jgi:hypothetical protein
MTTAIKVQSAELTSDNHTGKIASNRKENSFKQQYTLVGLKNGKMHEAVVARFYGNGSRAYCCVWVNGNGYHVSGGGYAGGYGYHRDSAAFGAALDDAGIKLAHSIGGVGDRAIEDAMQAIGYAIGYSVSQVFKAHA